MNKKFKKYKICTVGHALKLLGLVDYKKFDKNLIIPIHTGQNFDPELSKFYRDLDLKLPNFK